MSWSLCFNINPNVPCEATLNEIRDFVNDFPANLSRFQAQRRIHAFLAKATPRLLQAASSASTEQQLEAVWTNEVNKLGILKRWRSRFFHRIFSTLRCSKFPRNSWDLLVDLKGQLKLGSFRWRQRPSATRTARWPVKVWRSLWFWSSTSHSHTESIHKRPSTGHQKCQCMSVYVNRN